MSFKDILSKYVTLLDTSYSELAKYSGLGTSTLSRYHTGTREPCYDSSSVARLVHGFREIARIKGIALDTTQLRSEINQSLSCDITVDYSTYIGNLNILMKTSGIRSKQLAQALSYDTSHISKILSCRRRPGDITAFTDCVARLVDENLNPEKDPAAVKSVIALINADPQRANEPGYLKESVSCWLRSGNIHMSERSFGKILKKVDDFNLFEYIDSSNFENIQLPTGSVQLPSVKTYYNVEGMRDAELDFLRITLLSKTPGNIIMYNDMPLASLFEDKDSSRKWMFLMEQLLKKNYHIDFIHDVNRPIDEMIISLETNLPIYMTGNITHYYLNGYQGEIFHHLLKVSESAALTGMAVSDHQEGGRYLLNRNRSDVAFFKAMAKQLLLKAKPLMDIYGADKKQDFSQHMLELPTFGSRSIISCSLPIFTINTALFEKILRRHGLTSNEVKNAFHIRKKILDYYLFFLERGTLYMDLPVFNKAAFEKNPPKLFLSEFFIENDFPYLYEEYLEHLEDTKKFVAGYNNVKLTFNENPSFKNINITIVADKEVIVSKNTLPPIHFMVTHPKMVAAFTNYMLQRTPLKS